MRREKTFKKVNLWIPLEGDQRTIVNVDGKDGYTGTYHQNRIPTPSELGELEVGLLKYGAEVVEGDERKFIRIGDIVGRYNDGTPYRHLQYKVK